MNGARSAALDLGMLAIGATLGIFVLGYSLDSSVGRRLMALPVAGPVFASIETIVDTIYTPPGGR